MSHEFIRKKITFSCTDGSFLQKLGRGLRAYESWSHYREKIKTFFLQQGGHFSDSSNRVFFKKTLSTSLTVQHYNKVFVNKNSCFKNRGKSERVATLYIYIDKK